MDFCLINLENQKLEGALNYLNNTNCIYQYFCCVQIGPTLLLHAMKCVIILYALSARLIRM